MHVFVVVETDIYINITHSFISCFPHRPPAVAQNKAGSLTKALDFML